MNSFYQHRSVGVWWEVELEWIFHHFPGIFPLHKRIDVRNKHLHKIKTGISKHVTKQMSFHFDNAISYLHDERTNRHGDSFDRNEQIVLTLFSQQ